MPHRWPGDDTARLHENAGRLKADHRRHIAFRRLFSFLMLVTRDCRRVLLGTPILSLAWMVMIQTQCPVETRRRSEASR